MALLLKGARCIDPAIGLDEVCDVVVRDGKIVELGQDLSIPKGVEKDLGGKVLLPGFIDIHVHLREPGQEYKETIESGTRAAARGGFVGVCPMPNTHPVCDNGPRVQYLAEKAAEVGHARVYPVGALSKGLEGSQLAEMGDMAAQGAVAFSDDGRGLQSDGMMRRAMDYAKMFKKTVMSHCQREDLVGTGVVNEGAVSTLLGMAGWPAAGEEIQIARDIALCELTGCALHIQHITTAAGITLVRAAKAKGLPVTCEVTPHHLFLCEEDLDVSYNTNLKMNPPLRTRSDMLALRDALICGDIDCVASDHAPHAAHEKALEFELAPFGTTGLETTLPLLMTELVGSGQMGYARLAEVLAIAPRQIIGIEQVSLSPGNLADLTVIDPDAEWTVASGEFESASNNSAFIGRRLKGLAYATYVEGYASFEDGRVV